MKFCLWIFCMMFACCSANESSDYSDFPLEFDEQGRVIKDIFPNGREIRFSYNDEGLISEIEIDGNGSIVYECVDGKLQQVSRKDSEGCFVYKHAFEYADGVVSVETLIGDLGQISYNRNLNERRLLKESPWSQEICELDSKGRISRQVLDGKTHEYTRDNNGHLLSSAETSLQVPVLSYDSNGNVIEKSSLRGREFREFDAHGHLTKIITDGGTIAYDYDQLGRRIRKSAPDGIETYLYLGMNELATCTEDGQLKQLRIPGLFHTYLLLPVAIEIDGAVYASIHDCRGNLWKLIDIKTQEVLELPYLDPFGKNLDEVTSPTPWLFSSKHYDHEAHLVYFGSRYYDPEVGRWISPDPLGTLQGEDVYLYCLGDPLGYFDPDGKFALTLVSLGWGAGAVLSLPAWGTAAVCIAAGAAIGWAANEVIEKVKESKKQDKPPYDGKEFGLDLALPPADGFEWRGEGKPGSKEGAWFNPETKESLRSDLDHPPPVDPHWDYIGPNKEEARLFTDGTWEPKP